MFSEDLRVENHTYDYKNYGVVILYNRKEYSRDSFSFLDGNADNWVNFIERYAVVANIPFGSNTPGVVQLWVLELL